MAASGNNKGSFFYFLNGSGIEGDLNELLDDSTQEQLKSVIRQNLSTDDLRVHLENNLEINED